MTKTKKMRNKDYFRLAKQSLKSRKKSTRTTVAGIAFGLILILPVLYFTFAFFLDFNSKINAIPTVALFSINTTVDQSKDSLSEFGYGSNMTRGTETVDELLKTSKYKDVVYYNHYDFSNSSNTKFKINNGSFKDLSASFGYSNNNGSSNSYNPLKHAGFFALDYDLSKGKIANDSIIDYLKDTHNTTLLAGGSTFTAEAKGKGELLIAESYAIDNNIKVGDSISMRYDGPISGTSQNYRMDDDNNPNNYFDYSGSYQTDTYRLDFMKNFEVVGLISNEYYANTSTSSDPYFFMTTASYMSADGTKHAPVSTMKTHEEKQSNGYTYYDNYALLTYSSDYNTVCNTATANGQMAMLIGITTEFGGSNQHNSLTPNSKERIVRVQFDDYAAAQSANKFLTSKIAALGDTGYDESYMNELFSSYQLINMIGTIVVAVFLVFGGVILFATMINLYNSIQYSVESRRNYMGMLRAVGAKNNILNRMYFTEVILIFLKSLPWIVIFGGGMCVGIKFGIDSLFGYIGESFGLILSLSIWYIPLVFGLIFAFAFMIGVIYSRICCKPLTTRGILTLLKEDR